MNNIFEMILKEKITHSDIVILKKDVNGDVLGTTQTFKKGTKIYIDDINIHSDGSIFVTASVIGQLGTINFNFDSKKEMGDIL